MSVAGLSMAKPAAVECRSITQLFVSGTRIVHALADVDLKIERGEFVSIVGPSGCGKSTLLRLVAGLESQTLGEVEFEGRKVTKPQHEVGIVFQRDALLEWRSALDNVLLQIEMRRRKTPADVERAKQLLGSVGLAGFEGALPRELSGGMRQRVAICRALIHEPQVLLMDEPFGALDALTREQMMVDLQTMWLANEMSVLLITHSISEAVFLSDRVLVMGPRPGRVVADVSVNFESPRSIDLLTDPRFTETEARIREIMGETPR